MIPIAHAVLDMEAIRHNLEQIKQRAPGAKVMAVIKANAYGHGLNRIARALDDADAFAVARVDEGLLLRHADIKKRIAVLQGFVSADELAMHLQYGLEPVVHSLLQVELLEQAGLTEPLSVWLKLDSGMHRLGLTPEEFQVGLEKLKELPFIRQPISLMTHLANADELSDPLTQQQLDLFRQSVSALPGECSIANSAGLLAWDKAVAEWIRPGIALYGVSPFPNRTGTDEGLEPVMTLTSKLIAIKNLAIGDAVGYGGDWVCQQPTRMGIVAIGYGDGYPRHAPTGTPVLVGDCRVPLIGRVSMDMIAVDLNGCPEARVGDPVILWGKGLPVELIAQCAGTIPYELLCGVTSRVRIIELNQ